MKSLPNAEPFTFEVVRTFSLRFAPVRAESKRDVSTWTFDARPCSEPTAVASSVAALLHAASAPVVRAIAPEMTAQIVRRMCSLIRPCRIG